MTISPGSHPHTGLHPDHAVLVHNSMRLANGRHDLVPGAFYTKTWSANNDPDVNERGSFRGTSGQNVPTVVPAECMVYLRPLALSSFCTSATSAATDTFAVPTCRRHQRPLRKKISCCWWGTGSLG